MHEANHEPRTRTASPTPRWPVAPADAAATAFGEEGVQRAPDPAVLPPLAARFSLFIVDDVDARGFTDIPLPGELVNAVPRRQYHFRAGRVCAAFALRQLDPRTRFPVVGRDASGGPAWPDGTTGSITHTNGFVSAAAAWARDAAAIGIDAEPVMPAAMAEHVTTVVASPAELDAAQRAGLDRPSATTLVFCVKEAVFKALYPLVRTRFGYADVHLVQVDGSAGLFGVRVMSTLSPSFRAGAAIPGRFSTDGRWMHTGVSIAPDAAAAAAPRPPIG